MTRKHSSAFFTNRSVFGAAAKSFAASSSFEPERSKA
jgi:hypothetical protein